MASNPEPGSPVSRRRVLAGTGGILTVVGVAATLDWADVAAEPKLPRSRPPLDEVAEPRDRRVLNVVAHHDDDLLFLSPDLISDLRSDAHVRTVYLVASDYNDYPQYMRDREAGIRSAYAFVLDKSADEWRSRPYRAGGVDATLWTLGARVSILETRIPDGHMMTQPGAKRLWALYADDTSIDTRPGDTFAVQSLDRKSLVAFLDGVRAEYRPTSVNTLDPTADLQGKPMPTGGIHQDHIAVARMVMHVFEGVPGLPVAYYRDYTISSESDNLSPAATREKAACFEVYAGLDPDARASKVYRTWFGKTYLADEGWRKDLVVPLPPPLRPGATGNRADAPVLGRAYRLVNAASGGELAAGARPGDPLRLMPAGHGTIFRTQGVRFGWRLLAQDDAGCMRFPDQDAQPGAAPELSACRHDPSMVFRIHRARGGYLLTGAASGAALAAAGPGENVVQEPNTGTDRQYWRFVPV